MYDFNTDFNFNTVKEFYSYCLILLALQEKVKCCFCG